jgi:hypothetical protein
MNKIIDGVNYQYIDGYNNKRITGYGKIVIDEVIENRSGKSYNVYLKQSNVTYYAGKGSLSLETNPQQALDYIKSNSGLFGLTTFQRIKELSTIDERVNLLTWLQYTNTRYCVQVVNKNDYEYLISKDELQGHIQYVKHSKPLHDKHKPFNHPKLGLIYYESKFVYEYTPDLDLREGVINLSDDLEVLDYDNQSLVVDLEVQAMQQLLQETKN